MNTRLLGLAAFLSIASLTHGSNTTSSADHDYPPPAAGSYALPVVKLAADGQVLDTQGRARTLAEFTRDRITVLSFIYTRCGAAKACPYATGVLKELHRASSNDPELTRHLRLISLSFDPDFDTPEHLGHYARWAANQPAGCPWTFLTTRSQAELQPILTAYDQAVDRKRNPTDPLGPLNHTLRVHLIDADGRIRNIYSSGTLDPRLVLADIQTLILEQQTPPTTPRDPIPPSQAILHPGKTHTVVFRVSTVARISELSRPGQETLTAIELMDAPNGDHATRPQERSRMIVRLSGPALRAFDTGALDSLLRAFSQRWVQVTGQIHVQDRPASIGGQQAILHIQDPSRLQLAAARP